MQPSAHSCKLAGGTSGTHTHSRRAHGLLLCEHIALTFGLCATAGAKLPPSGSGIWLDGRHLE